MSKGTKSKKPETYTGPLTPRQAAGGINRAFANARRSTSDAELLLEHGRWPTAAALAVFALEECGKIDVLREVAMGKTSKEISAAWGKYVQHASEVGIPIGINPDGIPLIDDDALQRAVAGHRENAWKMVHLKEAGFYTDSVQGRALGATVANTLGIN